MELAQCLSKLSTTIHSPFMELPGKRAQLTMSPMGRDGLVDSYKGEYKESAVLILLFPNENNQTQVVFIKRASGGIHSNQIALPGGIFEKKDLNLIQTALRETEEEIGVNQAKVEVLSQLTPLKVPVSGFEIMPIVGYLTEEPEFTLDYVEIDQLIIYPLSQLVSNPIKEATFNTHNGLEVIAPYYQLGNEKLWGATAMIIAEFLEILK